MAKISIIGGGSWGLAMANLLSSNKHQVKIWEYNEDYVNEVKNHRMNSKLLPGIKIQDDIYITNDLKELFNNKLDVLIFAVPTKFLREIVYSIYPYITKHSGIELIINLAKGVEEKTLKRISEILIDELPESLHNIISTLSGPSHAEEVARGVPTAVVLAGTNAKAIKYGQEILSNEYFRVYTSEDIIGVELGGAIKNIVAIAAGIVDGLGYGDNTKGALLTRGIVEIKRLGVLLGANPETFLGLSGIGDLITTAISMHSRNRFVGYELGLGKPLEKILENMVMVVEGVNTAQAIYQLKEKLQVDMPIIDQIYHVLFMNKEPREAIKELMLRDLKKEDEND